MSDLLNPRNIKLVPALSFAEYGAVDLFDNPVVIHIHLGTELNQQDAETVRESFQLQHIVKTIIRKVENGYVLETSVMPYKKAAMLRDYIVTCIMTIHAEVEREMAMEQAALANAA